MRGSRDILSAGPRAVLVLSLLVPCAGGRAQLAEPKTVKLSFRTGGQVGSVYTPAKLLTQGTRFRFGESYGKIKVAGENIIVAGRYVGDGYMLGVDCNGDGKVLGAEWVRLSMITRAARFLLSLPAGEGKPRRAYALRFVRVTVGVRLNQATNLSGHVMIDGCMAGTFDDHDIWLYDDDLDGKYSQDGKDAIAVGNASGAMPLMKCHQIGKHHYVLDVDSDGTSITFQRVDDLKLGRVETLVRPSLLGCLMLTDESNGRSYDVKFSGAVGIPAGTYKLAYAVLGGGGRIVVAGPSAKSLSYTIAENAVNILRFGPPVRLVFSASIRRWPTNYRIIVRTDITPYGTGGERYHMDFAGYHPYGENPNVMFANGQAVLTNTDMGYDGANRLIQVDEWAPAGLSRKAGRILLTCDLPILGRAVGTRSLDDVVKGEKKEVPDPKQPAVATRKLPEGTRVGVRPPAPKPAPKPKPTPVAPQPPRPKPATRPAKPVAEDPEYQAQLMLQIAKAFLKQGKKAMGVAKLQEIIKKHPKTAAARSADDLLLDIELDENGK